MADQRQRDSGLEDAKQRTADELSAFEKQPSLRQVLDVFQRNLEEYGVKYKKGNTYMYELTQKHLKSIFKKTKKTKDPKYWKLPTQPNKWILPLSNRIRHNPWIFVNRANGMSFVKLKPVLKAEAMKYVRIIRQNPKTIFSEAVRERALGTMCAALKKGLREKRR